MTRERRWSMFIVEMAKFLPSKLKGADVKVSADYGLIFKKVKTEYGYSLVYIITFKACPTKEGVLYYTVFETVRVDEGESEHVAVLYNVPVLISDEILESIGKKSFLEVKSDFDFKVASMLATSAIKGE